MNSLQEPPYPSSESSSSPIRRQITSPSPIMNLLDSQIEQLADELNRRRAFAQKSNLAVQHLIAGVPPPPPVRKKEWALKKPSCTTSTSHHNLNHKQQTISNNNKIPGEGQAVSKSTRVKEEGPVLQNRKTLHNSSDRSSIFYTRNNHPSSNNDKMSSAKPPEEDDPSRLLNVWLGELDSIQKGLDLSMSCSPQTNTPVRSSPLVQMRRMSTPRIESPRLDTDRYSLVNLEESLDQDLDNILGELCALESDLSKSSLSQKTPTTQEPAYITAESVRLNKLKNKSSSSSSPPQDDDSAFGDNASSSSGNTTTSSGPLGLPSLLSKPSLGHDSSSLLKAPFVDPKEEKAEKIRLAIEKMKEAAIKKIFIKVFSEDGSTKSLLVDERMTVSMVCSMLAEKNNVKRDPNWGLVELLPDLHMERAYEDSEYLVENLLLWKADSKNTLWFIKRPEVYDLFLRPETYLLGSSSSQMGSEMEDHARVELLEEYFCSTGVGAPDVEGYLFLKAEGKKTWKKFYFVLRTSGLYYAPKGKKTSKDLICLATFDVNQVYFGVKWQPKFKAPTPHCFSIKHPQIQAKSPKYIRYLCAETEFELNRWVTGIRLAKYGKILNQNYRAIIEELAHHDLDKLARYSSQPSETENRSFDSAICPSPPPALQSINHSSSSEKSSSVELGFSCDSPEGGTIKKKPNFVSFKSPEHKSKAVRFKDTFSILKSSSEDEEYSQEAEEDQQTMDIKSPLYANIEEILHQTNITHDKFTKSNLISAALHRLSSSESLSSPLLHTGAITSVSNISHQPKRPAPVLASSTSPNTPSLVRKPSLDRFYGLQKRDGPTYEDTLKKCQSLTRQHSAPPPIQRKESPEKVISRLPPSGLQTRTLGRGLKANYIQDRSQQLNNVHINNTTNNNNNNAHTANGSTFPPPNRFSSGEYDNVSGGNTTSSSSSTPSRSSELKDRLSTPPLSKRNGDAWKRA